jgi:hypothetical protein
MPPGMFPATAGLIQFQDKNAATADDCPFNSARVILDWQPAGIYPVNTFNPQSCCMFYLS